MDTESLINVIDNTESAIPEKLRTLPRWKVTNNKNPGHEWNLDENLRTYDKALEHAHKTDADGVIYIVGKDDPFTFVDLDDCRNPETGDVAPWAMEIVRELDSYTEVSSSGKGLHIIVEGEKLGPRCRTNALPAFEMYDDVRAALITGDRPNEKDIEPRQPQIEDLYHEVFPPEAQSDPVDIEPTGLDDDEVLRLLTEVDPEALKWRTTLNGDWGEHYGDRSGADFAIAYKLGFYSGDPEQVQRIMNASGLYRDKWDTRRPGGTLLTFTVGNAFDRLDATYTPPDNSRLTVGRVISA